MYSAIKPVLFTIALTVGLTSAASTATAQSSSSGCSGGHCAPHYSVPVYHHRPVYATYGYRPYGYDYRFGVADIIRASAEANVLNANARTQHLHADRLQMENSVEFLHTRLERKRINRESRFGHLHAQGEIVRAEKAATQLVVAHPTPRPAVDPATGRVHWPLLLRTSHYRKARGPIDTVFEQRAANGTINPDHFLPMRDWITQIECELKANVRVYEMEDYLEAKDFLRSLLDEARRDVEPYAAEMQLAAN